MNQCLKVTTVGLIGSPKNREIELLGVDGENTLVSIVGTFGFARLGVRLSTEGNETRVVVNQRSFRQKGVGRLIKVDFLDKDHKKTTITSTNILDRLAIVPQTILGLLHHPLINVPRVEISRQ